jgi:DNA repair protein RadC
MNTLRSLSSPPSGPRERALDDGVSALGDAELLAVLLGTGTQGRPVGLVAAGLLERAGTLEALARCGPRVLAEHPGVGLAKAVRLAAGFELGQRVSARVARPRETLRSSAEVAAWFTPRLGALVHEEMWVISLDGRNGLRGSRRVAQGGLHGCSIAARDVLRVAMLDGASSFVLVHNHPSGDPTPSVEDVHLTQRVLEAAMVVGTPLVDHVIVTAAGKHASLLDRGLIDAPPLG